MDDVLNTGTSRRAFVMAGAAAACGALALGASATAKEEEAPPSGKLPITIAGYPYDRVRALPDKRVHVEGCDVTFVASSIGEMNTHALSGPQSREVTEIGLSPFMLAFCNDGFRDYELLPVPLLRLFRHKSIFIRTDRGIATPQDLRGRKIATPGYSSSSLTWIRGILQSEYGVKPEEIQWVVTGKDSGADLSGVVSKWENVLPKNLSITAAPEGKDESELLISGDVDAIFHATEPRAFVERRPKVGRLFPDHRKVERAYFEKTAIFPIMHMLAIRRDFAAAHPWLPKALFDAYSRAKRMDMEAMRKMGAYFSSLPWFGQELEETRGLMGKNFYPYGVEASRKALEAVFEYSHTQGLAKRKLTVKEVLNASTLDLEEENA